MKHSVMLRRWLRRWTLASLACICLSMPNGWAATNTKRLLIIHSYALDFQWTAGQEYGIQKAFDEYLNPAEWTIQHDFLDGKKCQENAQALQNKIQHITREIERTRPDAVILTDDLAFSSFYPTLKRLRIPVSFSGINGELQQYGYQTGDTGITGALERYNLPAVVRLMKYVRPGLTKVVFVTDMSVTSNGLVADVNKQLKAGAFAGLGVSEYAFYSNLYFENLQTYLQRLDAHQVAIVLLTNYTFKDRRGRPIHHSTIDDWIFHNTHLIDAGLLAFPVRYGRLLSLASDAEEVGYFCAGQLFQALLSGRDPSLLPIREFMPLKLVLNHERARELGVTFPFEILTYASSSARFVRFPYHMYDTQGKGEQ